MQLRARLPHYLQLIRLHKPIGILLLLWPTLWALWLGSAGQPDTKILLVFLLGTILMRSAGCIMNDIADRNIDGHVLRTRERPLVTGKVSMKEACCLMIFLSGSAFGLVLLCNLLTIFLAILGAMLVMIYPFMKRLMQLPQLVLGVAFSWSVPMAFAATSDNIPYSAWFLFLTCILWPLIYDTFYAMVDREDDTQIGIKSSAILFGANDKMIIGLLQIIFLSMLVQVGILFALNIFYYLALVATGLLFIYQQWLIKNRDRESCFAAFLNNNWVGLIIFLGIYLQ